MKVYVAGRVRDLDTVKKVQALVIRTGHEITFDWTPMVERWGGKPETTPAHVRKQAAISDRDGVINSELVIAVGYETLCGTLWECGMAAGLYTPVWLLHWDRCSLHSIFEDLPGVEFMDSLEQVSSALEVSHHTLEINERTFKGKIEG